MPSRVRRAVLGDVESLARLERRAFRGYYAPHRFTTQQFARYLESPRAIVYVVVQDGVVAGYVLGIRHTGRHSDLARLSSIAVDPLFQSRGFARRLLTAFLRTARRRGCRVAVLEVAGRNRRARALFEQHGFVTWRRLPDYYSPGVDGIRMRRGLAERRAP